MKFAIALFAAPQLPASRRALRFAQAAVAGGHQIVRLFFYQDGVHNASTSTVMPQDEADLPAQWTAFIRDNHLDAVVCISAALRRGLLDAEEASRYQRNAVNIDPPWALSGLGQLHEAIQDADRLICFGGH